MAASSIHTTTTGKRRTLFIPVGLPGSGKTWLANRLDKNHFMVISQDSIGCDVGTLKSIVEYRIKNSRKHLYIDSCNHYPLRRKDLAQLGLKHKLQVVFIDFRMSEEECRAAVEFRIKSGEAHPSVTTTEIAECAFETILSRYVPVDDDEHASFRSNGVSRIVVETREKLDGLIKSIN